MEVAKVTSKGQITIPISIRRKLEINEGDKVLFIYKPEGVMMVNPNTMQGGYTSDVVEAAEAEIGAEAVAAMKEIEAAKRTSNEKAPDETVAPPPVEEPPKKEKQVGGFDLSTLLDDIRSIGSNI